MNELIYNIEKVEAGSDQFNEIVKTLYPEKLHPFIKSPVNWHLKESFVLYQSNHVVGRFCLYHNPWYCDQ